MRSFRRFRPSRRARAAARFASTRCAAKLPKIDADPDKVRQILGQPVVERVKFTSEGGHVTVRADLGPLTRPIVNATFGSG